MIPSYKQCPVCKSGRPRKKVCVCPGPKSALMEITIHGLTASEGFRRSKVTKTTVETAELVVIIYADGLVTCARKS